MLKFILIPSFSLASKILLGGFLGAFLFSSPPTKAQFATYNFERVDKDLPIYLDSFWKETLDEDTLQAKKKEETKKPARWFMPIRVTEAPQKIDSVGGKRSGKAHFSLAGIPAVVNVKTRLKEEWQEAKELRQLLKKKKDTSRSQEHKKSTASPSYLKERDETIKVKESLFGPSTSFLPVSSEMKKEIEIERKNTREERFAFPHQGPLLISSPFGYRTHPISGEKKFHAGIDLKIAYKPIYAVLDAVVIRSGWDPKGGGNYLTLKHKDGFETSYLHLSELYYAKGEKVKAGYIIGKSGSSGSSTGPHLHFAVKKDSKPFSPIAFFKLNYLFSEA